MVVPRQPLVALPTFPVAGRAGRRTHHGRELGAPGGAVSTAVGSKVTGSVGEVTPHGRGGVAARPGHPAPRGGDRSTIGRSGPPNGRPAQ
ncbi:hypothetical protein BJF90_40215 [Pseudonocardia sp. CNS-004]|nr:hypothetical protein BJF90_40215 [Pseudonocardia sp. CNS-004]